MTDKSTNVTIRDSQREKEERFRSVERFRYSSAEQSPNRAFCGRCKRINFDAIFQWLKAQPSSQETAVADIGRLDRMMLGSTCPCCVFWAQIVFLNKPQCPFDEVAEGYLLAQSCRKKGSSRNAPIRESRGSYHKCLKLHWSGPSVQAFETWRPGPLSEHLIFPAGQGPNGAWAFADGTTYARHIEPSIIEYDHIIRSLQQCRSSHPSCKKMDPALIIKTRLIDCRTNPPTLVDGSTDMSYFALSYCWGAVQPGAIRRADETAYPLEVHSLPLTIRDAIFATINLGGTYLWVDAICIDQDDAISKESLINKMDYVYNNADLVLVALGDDSDTGLPGVSTPRIPQPALRTGDTTLVTNISDLREQLQASRWSSRGWTYQEALLARRCLFFTSEQWHFVCQTSSAYETLVEGLPKFNDCRLDIHALRSTLFRLRGTNAHDLEITEDVREYTIRDLSLDSDFLNAFRGVLRRSSLHSLCGVIALEAKKRRHGQTDLESGYALGLFWAGQDRAFARTPGPPRTTRRPGFPTWSWLSSRGVVDMTWSNPQDYIADFSGINVHASFSVVDSNGSTITLTSMWQNGVAQSSASKFLELQPGQHLQITSYLVKVRFMKPTQAVMLHDYWFVLDGPLELFPDDNCDLISDQPSAFFSATLKIATGDLRKIEDQESIAFDREAFSDPTLNERILKEEFELLLLVSHGFEQRQLNYWIILDKESDKRKRIGIARCEGYRYAVTNPGQRRDPCELSQDEYLTALPEESTFLSKKTTMTMV
ncbi:uncharacterized protein A1O5_08587 [Cladophialophora psammophila CBS 110553]|uniref:Heterokaryon incompatibility domain-containing protein n=1 Tax=Cladophialophora psammophila CBS 110553 TaxID=1182543 RepID=W9WJ89_9EURO|nr:uncharacterized protein A1O5_08587 [Cladophialophora psammophila CBS 110553]EXJ67973.1 hypothetical protein A1O5_08587 [Cladophialophora psammophila CBS 110553]